GSLSSVEYYMAYAGGAYITPGANIATMVAPVTGLASSDEYYFLYRGYLDDYNRYFFEQTIQNVRAFSSSGVALSPSSETSIYLTQANATYNQIASAGSAADKLNLYSQYLSLYLNYISAYRQWAYQATVATLPVAPFAPP